MNLFAYVTLMCPEIMRVVAGHVPSHEPGILRGYSRRSVKGEPYPALVPDEACCVAGGVYLDVSDGCWDRLDWFEGAMYARQPVRVELHDGRALPAETYVVQPAWQDRLDSADWDFGDFLRNGKQRFQSHYRGYRALKPHP